MALFAARNRLGIFYGILVIMLLVMGLWWLFFLTKTGNDQAEFKLQKLSIDRLHATFLIDADPRVYEDPQRILGPSFPHLLFKKQPDGVEVMIDPEFVRQIRRDARATRNMFLYEGFFFIMLLAAGSTILYLSWRSEIKFKETRELFLAGATHEFKTPLASLRLYCETLGRDGLGEADRMKIRKRMIEDMKRLENLVDDILSMSADDTFDQGPQLKLDLARECRTVLDDLKGFLSSHQAEVDFQAPDGAEVTGRRLTFALALRNLVVNAVRHSQGPVRVEVRVEPGQKSHRVLVRDNGPGIPRRLHDKVFECFYSGVREGKSAGAGIGLHLVRRNVENLGGRIELESETGAGCTFTMVLPAGK